MIERSLVFLDANVIAKPVTRTFFMVARLHSGFASVWSLRAEQEAAGHMRPNAMPPSVVREAHGSELTPAGSDPERFTATKKSDRVMLADTEAAGARFLVTEDVDDFGLEDLVRAGVSAVNPDLFLAERMTRESYVYAIELFGPTQTRPRREPERIHATIAKQHPLLFAAHADLYDVEPAQSEHEPPELLFRGLRCIRCEAVVSNQLDLGVCDECRRLHSERP
ncbi:hypothetical protein [Georgenia yuyongxinii]